MGVSSEIRVSSIGPRFRMDAEYYKPIYLHRARTLARHETIELGRIGIVTDGIHASPVFEPGSGIRYISAKCVKECVFDLSDAEEIAAEMHRKNPRTALQANDVIISTVGTIGFCAVVEDDMLPANSDRHVGIVRIRDTERYDPHYIAAFINSVYGRNQTIREATGNVQLNLFIYAISKLRVPFPNGYQKIRDQVRSALALRRESQELYSSGQRMLEEQLQLDKNKLTHTIGYECRLAGIFADRRWDAQHYRPKYEALMEVIRKAPDHRLLKNMITYNQRGVQPEYVSGGSIAVVNSQHIGPQQLAYDSFERSSESAFESAVRARIHKNDILVYTTGAYVGRTNVFLQDIKALASNHVNIIRLRPEYDPAYVSPRHEFAGRSFANRKARDGKHSGRTISIRYREVSYSTSLA